MVGGVRNGGGALSGTAWTAKQLLAYPVARSAPNSRGTPPFNPRPPGVIRFGSTTDVVYRFLLANPKRRYWQRQIVAGVHRSDKTVSWALVYLRSLGLIESRADGRHARNLTYRILRPT